MSVSQATRPFGSSVRTASRTESETWSATLSGCPSVTDSEVKENERAAIGRDSATARRGVDSRRSAGGPSVAPDELRSEPPVEHRADAFGDRHLDPEPAREVAQDRRRRQALDDLADLGGAPPRARRRARSARRRGGCGPLGCQHVTIRSPMPASPENVSGSAPSASPSRAISTRPRVTSAAFALSPSPSPSTAPAASAITFFAAAQSSTPIRSSLT